MKRNMEIPSKTKTRLSGDTLRTLVETSLEDDKAVDIVIIDLAGKTEMADFMVIATGQSSRQVGAMAANLSQKLKGSGVKDVVIEGAGQGDWVLIDAGDVLVHLFRPEVRDFGRFAEHVNPDFLDMHKKIMPCLLKVIKDLGESKHDMTIQKTLFALNEFVQNLEYDVKFYLEDIINLMISYVQAPQFSRDIKYWALIALSNTI